jgi:hypothetical protein
MTIDVPRARDPLGLDPETRHRIDEVLRAVRAEETMSLVVLSGSLAAGVGHGRSDVDLHVVPRDPGSAPRTTHVVDGVRVQLTVLTTGHLDLVAGLTESYRATRRDRYQIQREGRELWHLIRLLTSRLIWADDEGTRMWSAVRPDIGRQVLMATFAHPVARAAEDAAGMLARGDGLAALHVSKLALADACDVAVCAGGDLYAMRKFLVQRLRRSALAPRLDELWSLLNCGPLTTATPAELAAAVRTRLLAANGLVARSLLDHWDGPSHAPYSAGKVVTSYQRSCFHGLMRFADGFALAGPDGSLRVGPAAAHLWASVGEAPEDQLAAVVSTATGRDLPADRAAAALDEFARAGAIQRRADPNDPA